MLCILPALRAGETWSVVATDLLPVDAELARRAAGGDGAAFVRLYDRYSAEVFAAALAATGSIDAASEATQRAFLRILRWPPRLGAPDGDVAELLCALALGGGTEPGRPSTPEDLAVARLVGVGWLRSETVAKAGARYDADWSVPLWSPAAEPDAAPPPADAPVAAPVRRLRLRLPRLTLRLPSPAAAAAVLLLLRSGLVGTLLLPSGSDPMGRAAPSPEAAHSFDAGARADARRARRARPARAGEARLLRKRTLEPLLAP